MKKSLKSVVLAFAAVTVMLGIPANGFAQVAGVIGVKFGFLPGYSTSDVLFPTDAAGILVDSVEAVTNWNNLQTAGNNSSTLSADINVPWNIAQDSAGNALSGVTMTPVGFDDGWNSGGADCADGRLVYDFWKFNTSNGHTDAGGHHYITLTFSNLTASQYDVYVYINDNNGNYWGNVSANGVLAIPSSIDNNGFNGADSDPCSLGTPLHTATGYGNNVNYIGIPAVTATNGGIVVITVVSQGGGDMGVSGVELVPTGTVIETGPATAGVISESPANSGLGVAAGTSVTLSGLATGQPVVTYQWQTDGGNGGSLTNIPGATSTNLVVDTTGWLPGAYVYDYVAANSLGTNTSATESIVVSAASSTPAISVQFEGSGGSALTLVPAQVAGYVPQVLWNVDNLTNTATATNLVDNTGAATPMTVQVSYANGQYHSGDNEGTSDEVLMSGGFWSGAGYTINVTNVPYSLYYVYLYMLNDNNPNRRYGFTLGSQTYWGAVFNGNGYTVPPYALDTQTEELSEGSQMQASVVEFTGVTNGSFTITGQTPDGNIALMGMEIVNPAAGPAMASPINISPDQGVTVYQGLPVLLSEFAFGAAPLSYQWQTDGGSGGSLTNIPGSINSTLPVDTSSFSAGNYNYQVIVTNATGVSTSAVLTLTITASAPVLLTDITPAPTGEVYAGRTFAYTATFGGTLPISYQWTVDTGSGPTNIPGAISNTLVLSNVQLSANGIYTVTASNSVGGPVLSSSSTLTVLPDPAAPAADTYGALALSYNPVAYWRFNETNDPSAGVLPAYDYSGNGFDGAQPIRIKASSLPAEIVKPGAAMSG